MSDADPLPEPEDLGAVDWKSLFAKMEWQPPAIPLPPDADALGDECCRWIERVGRAARKIAPF